MTEPRKKITLPYLFDKVSRGEPITCRSPATTTQPPTCKSRRASNVVIVDLSLGQSNGMRLIEDILIKKPGLLTLVLSMHEESLYAERCFRAGAKGYIMKQEPPERVISAIKKVLKGEIYLSEKLSSKLINKLVSRPSESTFGSPLERLSNRELEVFQLIGQGMTTRKIAEHLSLSVKTVETYIDHIKKKMNFEDSRGMILYAVQWFMNEQSRTVENDNSPRSK